MAKGIFSLILVSVALIFQANALTDTEIDDFIQWNDALEDLDLMYFEMLTSSRVEMTRWMKEINAQFLSQIGQTVDRLSGDESLSECARETRSEAGLEIQEVVRSVISDLEVYQRDYVYLLQDKTDQYISFNQQRPTAVWAEANPVQRMGVISSSMENFIYTFYKMMFEISVEEITIEMGQFSRLLDETRQRAFLALQEISDRTENALLMC